MAPYADARPDTKGCRTARPLPMGRALPWSLSDADRGVTSDQRRRWRAGRRARVRRLSRHSRAVRQLHALLMPSRQLRGGLPAHGTRRSNDVGFLRIRHHSWTRRLVDRHIEGAVHDDGTEQPRACLPARARRVPTKNLIRTVCVTDRAVLGRRTINSVGMADVRSVEVDGRLASFRTFLGRRVSVHGLQAPAIRGCGQAACRW